MKKVVPFLALAMGMAVSFCVQAQNPPSSSPNPYNYNNNGTNTPQLFRTGYYNKANNGSPLLATVNGNWNSQTSAPFAPFTIASPQFQGALNCRILFPMNYNPNDGKKYPVVLFLHGKGEAGRNDLYSNLPCGSPPCQDNNEMELLWWGTEVIRASKGGEWKPNYSVQRDAFWIFPQNEAGYWPDGNQENGFAQFINPATGQPYPTNGQCRTVMYLMEYLATGTAVANDGTKFNVDPNRIYIHGLSAGGGGTYDFIYRRPDLFAAAIPYQAGGDRSDYVANLMRYTPIWMWQGGRDDNPCTSVSTEVFNKYSTVNPVKRDKQAVFETYDYNSEQALPCSYIGSSKDLYNGNKRYTLVPTQTHGSWFNAYDHPDLFRWLFSQNKLNISAFGDTVNCAGGSVRIGISPGFAEYQWKRDNTVLTFPATANEIDADVAGLYYVRIKRKNPYTNVTGDWSDWSGSIQIINAAGNGAGKPVITANGSLILPTLAGNTVTLTASDGYSGYAWSKDGAPLSGANAKTLTVSSPGSYTVRGTVATCTSPASDPVVVRTSPGTNPPDGNPTALTASGITATSIQLNWTDGSSNESAFEIYQAATAGGPAYNYLGTVPANTTTFTHTGLTPNTFYYYRIRAVNADGGSAYSNEATAEPLPDTEPPTAPTNLTATGISGNALTLNWTASTDNVGVTGYEIFTDGVSVGTSATNSFYATGLAPATDYVFTVRARDFRNNISPLSSPLSVTTSNLVSGIVNYTYYESSSSYYAMPDFSTLTEKKRGVVSNFSIAPRDREEFIQFKFESKLQVVTGGAYTFYTTSDDGSVLYLDGTLVVNNDGAHSAQERSGNITLTAGLHDIKAFYYNDAGTYGTILEVRWESAAAGIPKQLIPGSVLLGSPLPVVYFAKATGDLTNLATWGTNVDGSGTAPANFTASQQTFTISRAATLSANWAVSGSQSKIVVASGGSLNTGTFVVGGTAKMNLNANSTLMLGSSNLPALGTIAQASTINYTADANVSSAVTYGNLVLSGSGVKNFAAGAYNVEGNLTVGTAVAADAGAVLNLKGNLFATAATTLPFTLNTLGNSPVFTGNGNEIQIQTLNVTIGTTLALSGNGGTTNLTVLNTLNLPASAVLDPGANTLTLGGNGISGIGQFRSNGGSFVINTAAATDLYFAPSGNTIKDLTVNATGTVNLKSNTNLTGTLSLSNGTLNTTGAILTLVSNAGGTARLGKVTNGTLTGNLTVQRYIAKNTSLADPNLTKGWFHVATPVKNQHATDWMDNFGVQGPWMIPRKAANILLHYENLYNPAAPLLSPVSYNRQGWYDIGSTSQDILPGRGAKVFFSIPFFTGSSTFDNTGIPVTGEFDFGLTYSPTTGYDGGGWNFVANPYPADIDWTAATGWTKTGMLNTIYVWDSRANNGSGRYQTCTIDQNNQVTTTNGATGLIASGQAFFVRTTASNPVLKINEDAKTTGTASFLRTTATPNGLRIILSDKANGSDECILRLHPQAHNTFDGNFDAYKLYGGSPNIATVSADSKNLSINTIVSQPDTIALNLEQNVKGDYILRFADLETFAAGTRLYLLDRLTNRTTDIFSEPAYSFSITDEVSTSGNNRLAIVLLPAQEKTTLSGTIRTTAGTLVKGATVQWTSDRQTDQTRTAADGGFSFSPDYFGTYTLGAENNTGKPDISVLDVILARRYFAGKAPLSPYQLIAGDVDNTQTFTSQDLTWMQEYLLGHTLNLPKRKTWEFLPADITFKNPGNPFPYPTEKTLQNNRSTRTDFMGIMTGKLAELPALQQESVQFMIDKVAYLPGQTVRVPVKVSNFKGLSGYQFAIKWDKEMLAFSGVQNLALAGRFGIAHTGEGILTVVWDDASAESTELAAGTVVFEMSFKVVGTIGSSTAFAAAPEQTRSVAINGQLQAINVEVSNPGVAIVKAGEGFEVYPNYPNPFATQTHISFNVPEAASVEITVYNTIGNTIDRFSHQAQPGQNTLLWNPNGKNIENGIYFYTVSYKEQVIHKKMLVNR